jgi:hypothetical protein
MRHPGFRASTLAIALLLALSGHAQSIRDRTRPDAGSTNLTESQALELTLTLVQAEITTLQTWIRTAGTLDASGSLLESCVSGPHANLVAIGQRVRAFPPDSKSSVYQATVSRVEPGDGCIEVEATLARPTFEQAPRYVMEIVAERGEYLAIPNEAIIEEGDKQVVYMQHAPGQYMPMEIHTGLKGELYAEVMHGLEAGDMVVTFGSFFIDAEHKLKGTGQDGMGDAPMSDAHIHH